jgi:hypothetical protein
LNAQSLAPVLAPSGYPGRHGGGRGCQHNPQGEPGTKSNPSVICHAEQPLINWGDASAISYISETPIAHWLSNNMTLPFILISLLLVLAKSWFTSSFPSTWLKVQQPPPRLQQHHDNKILSW